jgi:putative transposase
MNPAKCTAEDYINFVIATPRVVTATEAERVQPEGKNAPAHDAFTRLLTRLEPDAEALWDESRSQVDLKRGILILDDSTLEKPYSKRNDLVYRHWSGKQKEVVSGINLITLLWTDGDRAVPVDYRVFDKDRDRKTKNDLFSEMLLEAHHRGFNPEMVCFDSWYASTENLRLCRGLSWHFLTRLKSNRLVNPDRTGLRAVSEIEIADAGRIVWLKDFGLVRVFRIVATDGTTEHWVTSKTELSELERVKYASFSWQIEQYHRGIKQFCLIERGQMRRRRTWLNHIGLCLRAFLRIESHCYKKGISWFEAKHSIIRTAVRAYLANPLYQIIPTA